MVRLLAVGMLFTGAACGGSESPPLVFDSVPPSTTGPPTTLTTTTSEPQLGPWVDVTANLAGMPSECGNLSYVAAHPATDQVIAGVALRGLWANAVGSEEWTSLGAEGSPTQITNRPVSIVFDRDDPNRFWESGNHVGPGVFRTTNGGATFETLGDLADVDGLSVDLSDPERRTLLAGSHERADLYRSTDGGATWTNIGANLPPAIGFATDPLVLDAQVHLLGTRTWSQGATGIFRTTDGGASWQRVATGHVSGPPLVAHDGSIYWPRQDGSALRSTDRGITWAAAAPDGMLVSSNMVELADGRVAAVGRTHVLVSANQGGSWRPLGPPIPGDGAFGLTYSAARNALFVWTMDCGDVVPPGSVQRLDLTPRPD